MAVRKRKVKRFVIDVNCFITIFINKETGWLSHYITQNKIEIFIDNNLVAELERVLQYARIKRFLPLHHSVYLNFVKVISTSIRSEIFDIQSPDPQDNYLYDIAITANAKLLVTGETALLSWEEAPVEAISLSRFKKFFK